MKYNIENNKRANKSNNNKNNYYRVNFARNPKCQNFLKEVIMSQVRIRNKKNLLRK